MNTQTHNSSKKLLEKKWFQAVVIVGVLGLGLIGSEILIATAPKAEKRPAEKKARLVEDMEIRSSNAAVNLTGYGLVQAEQQVSLTPQVSGRVQKLGKAFVPGQAVKRGDLLVQLDDTDYQLDLANAKTNLAQAKASLAQEQGNQAVAQADFDLLGMDVSEREKNLILRKPQLQSAQASVRSAEAAVQRAEVNLERTRIRAPFDGVVVSRQASIGLQASPNTPLGEIATTERFWINVALPQQDLKWLNFPGEKQMGSEVCVRDVASPSQQACHWGRVLSLQGFVQDNGRQAQVLVEAKTNAKADIPPLLIAQYVKATFSGRTLKNVFVLDPSHIHDEKVWINDNGTLRIQPITIAYRSQNQVLVSQGLQDGQRLITSNLGAAIEGMAVRTAGDAE